MIPGKRNVIAIHALPIAVCLEHIVVVVLPLNRRDELWAVPECWLIRHLLKALRRSGEQLALGRLPEALYHLPLMVEILGLY